MKKVLFCLAIISSISSFGASNNSSLGLKCTYVDSRSQTADIGDIRLKEEGENNFEKKLWYWESHNDCFEFSQANDSDGSQFIKLSFIKSGYGGCEAIDDSDERVSTEIHPNKEGLYIGQDTEVEISEKVYFRCSSQIRM
jgi:hypothetical protein